MQVIEAYNLQNITYIYVKSYQINWDSIPKPTTLTTTKCIQNISDGFVHGEYIVITGLSLHLLSD